jgi:hypothetical protein
MKVSVSVPVNVSTFVPPASDTVADDCVPGGAMDGRPVMVRALIPIVNTSTKDAVPTVAVTVNVEVPAAVGVPLMIPVDESRAKPAGSVPTVTAQVGVKDARLTPNLVAG